MIETNNRVVFYGLTVQEELIYFQTGLVCACAAFFLRPFFFFFTVSFLEEFTHVELGKKNKKTRQFRTHTRHIHVSFAFWGNVRRMLSTHEAKEG